MNRRKIKKLILNFGLILSGLIGVVMLWRGVWGLLDLYLFPKNKLISYIASILLGVIILLVDDFELGEIITPRKIKKLKKGNIDESSRK